MIAMRIAVVAGMLLVIDLMFCQPVNGAAASGQLGMNLTQCDLGSLPTDVRTVLQREFGGWVTQESPNLNSTVRERWEAEKPLMCPGIASGAFSGDKTRGYAVLLVRPEGGFKFVVLQRKKGQSSYEVKVLDEAQTGAANVFIRTVPIRKFFDEQSKKKFKVGASEGILFVSSESNEYEADIYFWAIDGYKHEIIDY